MAQPLALIDAYVAALDAAGGDAGDALAARAALEALGVKSARAVHVRLQAMADGLGDPPPDDAAGQAPARALAALAAILDQQGGRPPWLTALIDVLNRAPAPTQAVLLESFRKARAARSPRRRGQRAAPSTLDSRAKSLAARLREEKAATRPRKSARRRDGPPLGPAWQELSDPTTPGRVVMAVARLLTGGRPRSVKTAREGLDRWRRAADAD